MNSEGWAGFPRSSFILIVALWVLPLAGFFPASAAQPATVAAPQLADGVWTVEGRAISGRRQCGDWFVRLTNRQGRLSGVVALARGSVPLETLALGPDGSFTGATRAGLVGSRHARAYSVTGQFAGDTVNLTLSDNLCPDRRGTATRRGG